MNGYCSFEVNKLLKVCGFNKTSHWLYSNGCFFEWGGEINEYVDELIFCHSFYDALDWLIYTKSLYVEVDYDEMGGFGFAIIDLSKQERIYVSESTWFDFGDAVNEGIYYALQNYVLNKC